METTSDISGLSRGMERIDGVIVCNGIRPITDRIAREVLIRTDFAETHYMSMLAMLMGVVGAFTLIDPLSLWSGILGVVVILLALLLNEETRSVALQRLVRGIPLALSKQVLAWYIATPIIIQIAIFVSLLLRLSTTPDQEMGLASSSSWWYLGLTIGSVILYLYQLIVKYFVKYYQRSMSKQPDKRSYRPLFAYRYSKAYEETNPCEVETPRSKRIRYIWFTLWESLFPWHTRLETLLYRYAHDSGVPRHFVQQMPQSQPWVSIILGLLNDFDRWILLLLTLLLQWELWYMVITGLLLAICTVAVHIYLEWEYRKLYNHLLDNLHRGVTTDV